MDDTSRYEFPIFVSSTEYNLVDLRAELARFLRELGYSPKLSSEDGFPDLTPGLAPWESCLPVLAASFVVIIVIDGRYGKPLKWPNFKEIGQRHISPTHAEYIYAHKLGKRILVFVREDISAHYQTYRTALASQKGDRDRARRILSKALPKGVDFEALEFLSEIKTTDQIPWIRPFRDVTSIKRDVQGKLLNHLAEVFMIKELHVQTVIRAFGRVMEELSPEKRLDKLREIGVTRELVEAFEKKEKDLADLRVQDTTLRKELEDSKGKIEQGKKTGEEKTKLEKRVVELTVKISKLEGEITRKEQANAAMVFSSPSMGTVLSTGFPTQGVTNLMATPLSVLGRGLSSLIGGSITLTPVMCKGCNAQQMPYMLRYCPRCLRALCSQCWTPDPLHTDQFCPQCRDGEKKK
ncbi:MAG: DUF4062 domain-containing protein [Elusimicrobia bacterium]|nr:DUF4062 domain-containing protein [Elusimicrobiota bacterium]